MKTRLFLIILLAISTLSCTDNIRAKSFGGKMTINLESNQKLVNATWKDSDLWILTRPKRPNETPEIYTFIENSTFGVMQGEIIFIEK